MLVTHDGFRHATVRAGDIDIHVAEMGAGAPVILVHGFPQHWIMWRRVMRELAAHGFRVIAYDLRGMGGTTITHGGYDKRSQAKDLVALMDVLSVPRASVIGYDHGGGVALSFAFEHPDRVDRLGVIEYAPPGYGYEYGLQPTRDWQGWQLAFFTQTDVAVQFIVGKERQLLAWYFWHWSANPDAVDQADFEAYVRQLQKPGALRGGFSHFAAVFDDQEIFAGYADRKIQAPVLALGGERGAGGFVLQAAQRLAVRAEGGVVPGAGHWIADEQPDDLSRRLIQFLEQAT